MIPNQSVVWPRQIGEAILFYFLSIVIKMAKQFEKESIVFPPFAQKKRKFFVILPAEKVCKNS